MSQNIDLAHLNGGAFLAMFNEALNDAIKNILDPNMPSTAPRSVMLKIAIKPDDSRTFAQILASVKTQFAGQEPQKLSVHIGQDKDGIIMREANINQLQFDEPAKLARINGGAK